MSTNTAVNNLAGADAAGSVQETSSANINTNLTTYRQYGEFDEKGQAKGKGSPKPAILSETQTKKNWEGQEKDGAVILTENAFKFYTVTAASKDELHQAMDTLVPDAAQQTYIFQKGLDAIQSAAANKLMAEVADKTSKDDPDVFTYNGDTIDLRDAINTPPQKKFLTEEEKFMRAISVLDPSKVAAMLEQLKRNLQAQSE